MEMAAQGLKALVLFGLYGPTKVGPWSFYIFSSPGYDLSSFSFGFCPVSGHDFSRAAQEPKMIRALALLWQCLRGMATRKQSLVAQGYFLPPRRPV